MFLNAELAFDTFRLLSKPISKTIKKAAKEEEEEGRRSEIENQSEQRKS